MKKQPSGGWSQNLIWVLPEVNFTNYTMRDKNSILFSVAVFGCGCTYSQMDSTRTPGGGVQHVLHYLKRMQAENPAFYYAVQFDGDPCSGNIFWVDPAAQMNYTFFGDAVILDTTYRSNHYKVPFASISGLNHHGQPVLFGCALMLNESESSFIWLLQTWLHAMSGRFPVSITTDPDGLILIAVSRVLPVTCHRFCKWGIFRETKDKLAHLYQSETTFELEFKKCINETVTVDEFETCWQSLLERYYVTDDQWLQSIYNARQQWVPVYMRGTFFGDLLSTQRNEGLNAFFDSFINEETTIQMLINEYEKAVANWHEKELKADHDTANTMPVLKTPSPMEKQAAGIYTKRVFMKFQEELVETLANPATKVDDSGTVSRYKVAKFGEEHRAHNVTFNSFEMKANCSCQMFEYSGIICRHVLSVFRAKNMLTLPSQYILKRWTRNAESGAGTDERGSDVSNDSQESLTVRYNRLRQEAIKFVEEGAKSIHIYNVAMGAMQEAAKKVAAAKNKGPEVAQVGQLANGVCPTSVENQRQSAEEKQKKIRELTAELQSTNQRCEVYRSNLLAILKDMEEQKLKLSVKVQNARLSLKD